MTGNPIEPHRAAAPTRKWPDYAAVWRWHFYAGLLCMPFVLWLAVTGSVYLFRPQIEALIDRPYAHLPLTGPRATASAQATAAVRAVPGSVLHRYQLPDTPDQAVQVIVGRGGAETRVYVHPQTLAILRTVDEDDRLMRIVFRMHGELLIGDVGSYLVELAASWAIVMVLTGLYLWWPRGRGLAGTLYPRLSLHGRPFWRDLHAVIGIWVSVFALLFLLSGLPWAKSWGSYLKAVRSVAANAPAKQDWSTGHSGELRARADADRATRQMMGDHAEHGGMIMAHPLRSYAPLDRLVGVVRPLHLAAPVLIAPPAGRSMAWTAKSDAADRPLRTDLTLTETGVVLTRKDFGRRPLIDRIVGYGVAGHEGQLFGWVNQLLNLLVACGLALLAVSGAVMWWRRRPEGVLGGPPASVRAATANVGLPVLLAALGLLLPLFGLSLAIMLVADRTLLRYARRARSWLGLSPV